MSIGRIEMSDGKKQYVEYTTSGGTTCVPDVRVGNPKDLSLEKNFDNLTLTWKDPDDVVFNGNTIAEWAGTKVIRKEGSPPTSIEDGVLLVDNTVKDQYASTGLRDADVVDNTEYNYALFPYTTKNIYTLSDLNRVSGSPGYSPLLAENTWRTIHEASTLGIAKDLWKIGDEKDGFKIIDFDHDDLADGSGKAGITFEVIESKNTVKSKYSTSTSYVNYPNSVLKAILESSIWDLLLAELKEYIKPVNKLASMSYNSSYRYNVADIVCKLFPFAFAELFGITESPASSAYTKFPISGYEKFNLEGTKYQGINKWFYLDGKIVSGHTRTYNCSSLDSKEIMMYATNGYDIRTGYATYEEYVRYGFCI